jgi:hypothetical protein
MTSPTLHIEFFFRANQFRRAYVKLPLDSEPPDWPKYVLFYHAIELALKAYLIQCGVSVEELRDEYRHDLKKLVNDAVKRGLSLPDGSKEMIADVGGPPVKPGQAAVAPHLRIRYPLDSAVYSLGQFDPYIEHVFKAVARALGMQ